MRNFLAVLTYLAAGFAVLYVTAGLLALAVLILNVIGA
jgi:hypothetical protein